MVGAAGSRSRLAGVIAVSQAIAAAAIGCPAFDANNVAYLFTAEGDFSLGSNLANATAAVALEASNSSSSSASRPSFTGNSTQCFTVRPAVSKSRRLLTFPFFDRILLR